MNSGNIVPFINIRPDHLPPDPAREWKKEHVMNVPKKASLVLIGTFAAIAATAVAVRIAIHLRKRATLFLDDYLVILATACLAVQTGLLYNNMDMMYMQNNLAKDPRNILLYTRPELLELTNDFLRLNNAFMICAWTTNYLIKASFLVFFRGLLKNVSMKLNIYWWFVVALCIAGWTFSCVENIVSCGWSRNMRCFPTPKHIFELGRACTAADIVTDALILSIPILLLRKTRLPSAHKIRILAFLCLSIFMAAIALVRLVRGPFHNYVGQTNWSLIWANIWLDFESCISVLMGGVTAFRSVFPQHARSDPRVSDSEGHSSLFARIRKYWRRSGDTTLTREGEFDRKNNFLDAPNTGVIMKGLRTFIRRNGREPGETTLNASFANSMYDPLESYHNFKRHEHTPSKLSSGQSLDIETRTDQDLEMPSRPMPVLATHNMV